MSTDLIVTIVLALLASVIGPIIASYFKEKFKRSTIREEKDILRETIEIDKLITTKLEEIQENFNTNRIWLCQFHNGGYYYPTGKSMQKFSMTYELCRGGMTSIQNQFQNVPIGLFSKPINTLSDGEVVKMTNPKEYENYGLGFVAEQTGAKSGYMFSLKTIDNKFIGMVGIGFKNKTILDQEQLNNLEFEINTISGVLMNGYLKNE